MNDQRNASGAPGRSHGGNRNRTAPLPFGAGIFPEKDEPSQPEAPAPPPDAAPVQEERKPPPAEPEPPGEAQTAPVDAKTTKPAPAEQAQAAPADQPSGGAVEATTPKGVGDSDDDEDRYEIVDPSDGEEEDDFDIRVQPGPTEEIRFGDGRPRRYPRRRRERPQRRRRAPVKEVEQAPKGLLARLRRLFGRKGKS